MGTIYCGPPPIPVQLWTSWNLDPWLLGALAILTIAFRRNKIGLAAVAILAVAFVSPLCALSSALFSARAAHHVILVAIAAPLLAQALPARRARALTPAFLTSTVILWIWHIPAAYDLALSTVAIYWLMQLTLLASATWFWGAVFAKPGSLVDRMAFIVASFAQMGMLGAILTFAPQAVYAAHAVAPYAWGLTPLEDQQLAGLIMWVPAAIPYAGAAAFMARRNWVRVASGAP
ncbi:MAG: cytochrome c oxidase assembly protein [Euryhalocaulis sp.]|uniref:cytochrome c oxidase assembly protein n=1 Tax=Euryhalocaulis sp. TaxID=2744307 RepID=UPI00178F94E4|nr:cytochrome c oxidase assembly protein [Euryhalocaulis sp.]MBA4800812.1 cytochrome c oxidase assembly protein [Euryhalocaulis sp.]